MIAGALPFLVQIGMAPDTVNTGQVFVEHGNPGYVPPDYWADNYQPQVRLITAGGAQEPPPDRWRVNPVFLIP